VTRLGAVEARVVGSLIEKQLTTPQQYPLTANALVLACNQASNRDPVVDYSEDEVLAALEALRERRLVRFVLPSHGRSVVRYRHVLDEVLGLAETELALLAVLLLRGQQTVGELRARTERMADFDGLEAVEGELERLAGREDPLVVRLPRRPGQKEDRWSELLGPAGEPGDHRLAPGAGEGPTPDEGPPTAGEAGVPAVDVAAEVAALKDEVAALRAALEELRQSLGG
jgi:uncharacterized protein YceH (UPF0502 family)